MPLADGAFRYAAVIGREYRLPGDDDRAARPCISRMPSRAGPFRYRDAHQLRLLDRPDRVSTPRWPTAAGCASSERQQRPGLARGRRRSSNPAGRRSTSGSSSFAATIIGSASCWRAGHGPRPSEDRARRSVFAAGPAHARPRREHHHLQRRPVGRHGHHRGLDAGRAKQDKQVTPLDFHPVLKDMDPQLFRVKADGGSVTFAIATPGEMTRLRLGGHYRVRDQRDSLGPCRYRSTAGRPSRRSTRRPARTKASASTSPWATSRRIRKAAQVRWVGTQRNTTCLFLLRIDADYRQPQRRLPAGEGHLCLGGRRHGKEGRPCCPVAAGNVQDHLPSKPTMKSITLELAESGIR